MAISETSALKEAAWLKFRGPGNPAELHEQDYDGSEIDALLLYGPALSVEEALSTLKKSFQTSIKSHQVTITRTDAGIMKVFTSEAILMNIYRGSSLNQDRIDAATFRRHSHFSIIDYTNAMGDMVRNAQASLPEGSPIQIPNFGGYAEGTGFLRFLTPQIPGLRNLRAVTH